MPGQPSPISLGAPHEPGIAGPGTPDAATLDRFAELVVRFAANVQRGQIVAIGTEPGKLEVTRAIAAAAYRAGAKYVDVTQFDLHVKRSRILHAEEDTLDYVPPWLGERILALGEHRAARIGLTGPSAPGLLSDLDPQRAGRDQLPFLRENARGRQRAHDELDGRAVPDAGVGVARVPRARARGGARARCGSRSCTCAASTSPIPSRRGPSARTCSSGSASASPRGALMPCTSRVPGRTCASGCCRRRSG